MSDHFAPDLGRRAVDDGSRLDGWNGRSRRTLFRKADNPFRNQETAMRSRRESTAAGEEFGDETTPSPGPAIRLTYNQAGQIHVTGPVTGERYAFADSASALEVNPRDAAALLRSGLFRRA